jgi:phage terminase small subunit
VAQLTPRQAAFVREYLTDLNATQAAIRAGYSPNSAEVEGSRLLRNAQVLAAVNAGKEKRAAKLDLKAEDVLERLREIAFANPDEEDELGNRKTSVRYEHVLKAAELLGKHLVLFTEKVEHSGADGQPISVIINRTVKP